MATTALPPISSKAAEVLGLNEPARGARRAQQFVYAPALRPQRASTPVAGTLARARPPAPAPAPALAKLAAPTTEAPRAAWSSATQARLARRSTIVAAQARAPAPPEAEAPAIVVVAPPERADPPRGLVPRSRVAALASTLGSDPKFARTLGGAPPAPRQLEMRTSARRLGLEVAPEMRTSARNVRSIKPLSHAVIRTRAAAAPKRRPPTRRATPRPDVPLRRASSFDDISDALSHACSGRTLPSVEEIQYCAASDDPIHCWGSDDENSDDESDSDGSDSDDSDTDLEGDGDGDGDAALVGATETPSLMRVRAANPHVSVSRNCRGVVTVRREATATEPALIVRVRKSVSAAVELMNSLVLTATACA